MMRFCTTATFVVLAALCNIAISSNDIWWRAGRMTGLLLNKCFWTDDGNPLEHPERMVIILKECLKKRGLKMLEWAVGEDVIEVVDGVKLVRYREKNSTEERIVAMSRTYNPTNSWKFSYIDGVRELLETHILEIKLAALEEVTPEEGRNRRRQNMFSQLLTFALIAASFIVIPMGFQFLAILGGKALLLAKMALLLTSIQGLKKIATSNLNYGLYSAPFGQPNPWQNDRHWPYDGPEGLPHPGSNYYRDIEGSPDLLHPRNDVVEI
ncbi:uncharacterized protein LOC126883286 isoform X2 [Diabrotica virgifera virgifera]|uniref:Uncharacterized protein n=1 Tax=Diabrotica virgifera virgifera TaxID=50390 RepID=A0ABM5K321_DIAVI|nr:uncharacterized protein LOC126883286 isoform X2 [Diabrotica virgifera virgifera]